MSDRTNPYYAEHLSRQGFELKGKLGAGLSGSVYEALQPSLGRKVAVKFFDNEFSQRDADLKKRFQREAQILAKLSHPNIPYALTTGMVNGTTPYTVMQYIDGETLETYMQAQTSTSLDLKLSYIRQVLSALDTVHANNILHRDIKPSNIMVAYNGPCFLIDFSIGAATEPQPGLTRATKTGSHLGTPAYCSPEQSFDMTKIDNRSDLYSVGVVLLELLTGSNDKTDIRPRLNELGSSIASAVAKACHADPNKRFQSATEFSRALGTTVTTRAKPVSPALALCSNTTCSNAQWSSQGYYRGPNIIQDSLDVHCTSCGTLLTYLCSVCGEVFADKPFCGGCGAETYRIPECERCGSFLKKEDMNKDTASNGCQKCRRKQGTTTQAPTMLDASNFEDDIPF